MADAFRSDLEAARSRADALEDENDELRDEVARLRVAKPIALGEATQDPAIAKLSEETLERLDEMTHAIEVAEPPPPDASAPLPAPHHADTHAPLRPLGEAQTLEVARLRGENSRLRARLEVALAAELAARKWKWRLALVAFVAVVTTVIVAFRR